MYFVWIKVQPEELRLSQCTINTLTEINRQQITVQPQVHEYSTLILD